LKNRIHATLMTFGHPVSVSDLFGAGGRELLEGLALPEPWATTLTTSLRMVDELNVRIDACEVELRRLGADHPAIPLLLTVPGVGWVLAYTIASKDRRHRSVRRHQEARRLHRTVPAGAPVRRQGPTRTAGQERPEVPPLTLIEAATHAARDPRYRTRYERTKHRLGPQRGAKVARVDLARQLSDAIWHVLTKHEPFAPAGPAISLVA
jgi:hypothetical protein